MTKNKENMIAIRSKVLEVMAELRKHNEKLDNIQGLADMKIYDTNHLANLRDEENTRFYNVDANLREELRSRIDNLFNDLNNRPADINNPNFQTAFNMINVLGSQMDSKSLNDVISNFRGQFAELNLLKRACVASNVGNCIAQFDDYLFSEGDCERLKRQVDNLLVFSHSFGVVAGVLGEDICIDGEDVVADATRAFSKTVL